MNRFLILSCVFLCYVTAFADNGPNHRKRQIRPIHLGTSGGNVNDFTISGNTITCCSGTLGAVVSDVLGNHYILSNNHVLAKSNAGRIGDPISQPGLTDTNCRNIPSNSVATLSRWVPLHYGLNTQNNVDAAIALVNPGQVVNLGGILDEGRPGSPVPPALGMLVKKSGRTTGLRRGVIDALNVSVLVEYDVACGSKNTRKAVFKNQIHIVDAPGGTAPPFVDSGDSGSLLVQNLGPCPHAVGLIFAGDGNSSVANRIQNVLNALGGVSIVGCAATASAESVNNELTMDAAAMINAQASQARHEEELFRIPGVVGVGIGLADPAQTNPAFVVYLQRDSVAATKSNLIPAMIDGIPVRRVITNGFHAL